MATALPGLVLFGCAAVALYAQAQPSQEHAGLEADWDIAAVLQGLGDHAAGMLPMLDRVDAQSWVSRGASETYVVQLQSSKDQARAVADAARTLAKHPEQLSALLEIYFRIQGIENVVNSLAEGIRRYQTPGQAQELIAMAGQNTPNRDRLQRYLVNLAAERERDLQVMDREAQRCRAMLTEPASKPGRKR